MSKIEVHSLPVPLSDEDFKLRAHNLAVARQKAREIESEKKSANTRFAALLKEENDKIDQLAQVVKTKSEHRPVNCEWVEEHKTGTMRLIRLDTETEINSRPMTMAERQSTLNFGKKNGTANGDTKPDAKAKKNGKHAKATTTETTPAA